MSIQNRFRRTITLFLLVFVALLLSACAAVGNSTLFGFLAKNDSDKSVVSSPQDPRLFRTLSLPNQMRVLLIQDSTSEKAAASLDVQIGSRQDPEHRQGLAHFLEHMLFLGTEKYPEADDYQNFISEHGGSHNAYTSFEHTNYYFDIANNDLAEALDRFAQFFISPRFDPRYVEREMNAVESEYRARYKDEARRVLDATKTLVSKDHPWQKFTVGSLTTLSGPTIRSDLLNFYQRYYSADKMTLAVIGNQSLDELEQLVQSYFGQVENRQQGERSTQTIDTPLFSKQQSQAPRILSVRSEKAFRQLSFTFPVPDIQADYRYKPLSFIAHLLGHEGEGSLLSALKAQGLAESLSAGVGLRYQGGATFQMDLALTEDGLDQVERVIEHVFAAVGFLQQSMKSDADAMEVLYQEQSQLSKMAFYFFEKPGPIAAVVGASAALHFYQPKEVIVGDYIFSEFKPELIRQRLKVLSPDNALISIVSDQLPERFNTEQLSPWFAAPYSVHSASDNWRQRWASFSQQRANQQGKGLLALPEPNQFIPNDFTLLEPAVELDSSTDALANKEPETQGPKLISEQKGARLWHQTEFQFRVPKVAVYLAMLTKRPSLNAQEQALASLYVAAVNEQLNEYLYPAYLTGMRFSFYSHLRGFTLKLGGYNDSIEPMLARFMEASTELSLDQQRVDNLKVALNRSLLRSMQTAPYQRLSSTLSNILYQQDWSEQDVINALDKIELSDVQHYFETIHQAAYFDVLTHGNISEEMALSWFERLVDVAHCQCDAASKTYVDVTLFPRAQQLFSSVAVDHADAAVRWYIQAPDDSLKTTALTSLTAAIMHPPFFNALRTEQQLGYIVGVQPQQAHRWPGLVFLVQSPSANEQQLMEAINDFIQGFLGAPISESVFTQHRDAMVAQLREVDINLFDRSARYWYILATGDEAFTQREELAQHLEALDYSTWKAYTTTLFGVDQAALILTTETQIPKQKALPGLEPWPLPQAPSTAAYR